ncbi:AAA family ATPase [Clostridium grantii]|uniref:AAA domain-containing protein n=1 Tax=Clostridium grantii DSM 8605 TaxID=1121316 RepID=A0A1M5U9P5_9CLOT|nr:AAA family ATPase [Clostridium grantii]SHH59650.1 AAA domain-containing protein [Clostridium grantii DSM 8605]
MIFESIRLKEGFIERKILFAEGVNLIHSIKNSRGKTTLLRFMLYALGYNIPNTKKIKFNNCEVELVIECEKSGVISLLRCSDIAVEVTIDSEKQTFVLPEQQNELHKIIFGTENVDILRNLLGTFYVDQEKGWTLLNRGVVIGSIHFNIEELIRGLSGRDCSELIQKEARLSRELTKYRQMFSIAQYRETLEAGELVTDSYEEESDISINQFLLHQKRLRAELRRIDSTLANNKRFKQFVADMKLLVQSSDGSIFPVTENNIVGLNDAIDLLIAKRKMVSAEFATVTAQLERLEKEKDSEYEQVAFYKSASLLEVFDKRIAKMPMNPIAIKNEINRLEKELKSIRNDISTMTKSNNSVVSAISQNIVKYAIELGLGDKGSIPKTYLFTSNLKELSGAVLHKTAFAFRLAYIIAIEDALKIKLPIILDSPSGKEVDQANVKLMMEIIKRDFVDHQIIIASIFNYDFDEINNIEIKEHLIEVCENE